MTLNKIIVAAALVLGASLGISSAALAQSAYTTGTIASDDRAGYPAVDGYGAGRYASAPGYVGRYAAKNFAQTRRGHVGVAQVGVER
jgi:hypothetical protein